MKISKKKLQEAVSKFVEGMDEISDPKEEIAEEEEVTDEGCTKKKKELKESKSWEDVWEDYKDGKKKKIL